MRVKEIESKKEWDDFLIKNNESFTQSIGWGRFKSENQRVERIEARKEGELVGVCQFLEEKNPFGEYFYIPYGPVGKNKKVRDKLFNKVGELAKKEEKTFVKAEPTKELSIGKKIRHRLQPKTTLIKDISDSPDEILKSFKKGTRYSVRYSQRKGVEIKKEKNSEVFFKLLKKTKKRQEFETFPKNYFKSLLKEIRSDLFLAVHENNVVAATIFGYFGETATSLHSAFDYKKRKLRATSLIRFAAIKEAKKKGCTKFDSWGIDKEKMPGVTKFKKGFGGMEVDYPNGKDLPIKKIKYSGYDLAAKITKK